MGIEFGTPIGHFAILNATTNERIDGIANFTNRATMPKAGGLAPGMYSPVNRKAGGCARWCLVGRAEASDVCKQRLLPTGHSNVTSFESVTFPHILSRNISPKSRNVRRSEDSVKALGLPSCPPLATSCVIPCLAAGIRQSWRQDPQCRVDGRLPGQQSVDCRRAQRQRPHHRRACRFLPFMLREAHPWVHGVREPEGGRQCLRRQRER